MILSERDDEEVSSQSEHRRLELRCLTKEEREDKSRKNRAYARALRRRRVDAKSGYTEREIA